MIDARLPMTVRDLLGLALQRRPIFLGIGKAITERMIHSLRQVIRDPKRILDRPVEKLSGGEMQRVLLSIGAGSETGAVIAGRAGRGY